MDDEALNTQNNLNLLADENNNPIQSGLVPIDSNTPNVSLKVPEIKA